jgi:large subunit ribosomal protein L40e
LRRRVSGAHSFYTTSTLLGFTEVNNMGKFPEADARLLNKKICMSCYSKNSVRATRCRRCGYVGMRLKAKESRKK